MFLQHFCVLCFLFFPATSSKNRIINGEDLNQPIDFAVKVEVRAGNGMSCGGVLIKPKFVVSAAHCFMKVVKGNRVLVISQQMAANITVLAGHPVLANAVKYEVKGGLIHPDFNRLDPKTVADLAVLLLKSEVASARPIQLPSPTTKDVNTVVSGAGWGVARMNGSCMTNQMGPVQFEPCSIQKNKCKNTKPPPQDSFCTTFFKKVKPNPSVQVYSVLRKKKPKSGGQGITCYNSDYKKNGWCYTDKKTSQWGFCTSSCNEIPYSRSTALKVIELYSEPSQSCKHLTRKELCVTGYFVGPTEECYEEQGNGFQLIRRTEGRDFAYSGYKSMAPGDSGSPIWTTDANGQATLVGVFSKGAVDQSNGKFQMAKGLSTRIKPYMEWIDFAMEHLEKRFNG